ncbi:hypothetical protein F5X68DRAFT_195807 [Plectosphaerella plurivora]|uniref:DUF7704 domain-containing protein n=1 Tax=Plectosphaerella plurivora TaxID=936078 RepID=A0A9P8V0X8_9PEZI|nr:hypothetical protein F5X68DRAFT_195807 [Plectosphaerella plurivora]
MADVHFHPLYHISLTWVDPLLFFSAFVSILIDPGIWLDYYVPASISQVDPIQNIAYQNVAVMYGFLIIMTAGLQRISTDVRVWKTIQAGVLFADVGHVITVYASLVQQDRLQPDRMRVVDWANFIVTAVGAFIRICFLAGVGIRTVGDGRKQAPSKRNGPNVKQL